MAQGRPARELRLAATAEWVNRLDNRHRELALDETCPMNASAHSLSDVLADRLAGESARVTGIRARIDASGGAAWNEPR